MHRLRLPALRRILTMSVMVVAALSVVSLPTRALAEPVVWNSVPLSGLESSHAPAIEDFKGRLRIAATSINEDYENPNGGIFVNSVAEQGEDLASWAAVPGLVSPSGPALRVFKKKLYIAARGPDNKVYLASSSNGTTWSSWNMIPGSVATEAPALKVFNNRLFVATRGENGAIFINSTGNGTSWNTWREVPNSVTPYAPALTQFNGKLVLGFTVATEANGRNGYVYITRSSDGKKWSAREQVPDFGLGGEFGDTPLTTDVGPGLTVLNGLLYISARVREFDVEDSLYLITNDGDSWSAWEDAGRSIEGSATLTTFNDEFYVGTRYWDSTTMSLLFR